MISVSALRRGAGRAMVYVALAVVAVIMLFPFIFMVAGALKTPDDTFRYPPRILPRSQSTEFIDEEERDLFKVDVPGVGRRTVFLVDTGIPGGLFGDTVDFEAELVAWPLEFAAATGDSILDENGESLDVFSLTRGPVTTERTLVRETVLGRFLTIDDPQLETFAVVRTAESSDSVDPQWSNFTEIIEVSDIDRSLTNTVLVTILVVGGTLFTSIMGGFAFSRVRFPGRDAIFLVYIGSIMIPFVVLIVPLFRLMVGLGWVNTLGSLVWPFMFNAYGTFLLRQFFAAVPTELEEAAIIDGASRWTILWRIYVPLSWPAIATLSTFTFLYAWNSFIWPLVSINLGNRDDFVLTLALQNLNGQAGQGPNLLFAAIVLAVAVPFTVFVLAQRYFVENVATSGIK